MSTRRGVRADGLFPRCLHHVLRSQRVGLLMVISAQRLMEEGHDDDSIFVVATHVLVFSGRFYMVTLNFSE